MAVEYEAKKLGVNVVETAAVIFAAGGVNVAPRRLMRRRVYDVTPGDQSQWIRLRDTGEKIQLTHKIIRHDGVDGTDEIEVDVDSFERTHRLLEALGFKAKAYQENYRTSYELDDVQVEIDEWPALDPYVEIEGPSVEAVHEAAARFGWSPEDLTSVNTKKLYADIGIDLDAVPELRFT